MSVDPDNYIQAEIRRMRDAMIQFIQRWLERRYHKHIVEKRDPFRDMKDLVAASGVRAIVDGGAYHGDVGNQLLSLFPMAALYAFEPATSAYGVLRKNMETTQNAHLYNLGLSSKARTRTLFLNSQDSSNAVSPTAPAGRKYHAWQTETIGTEQIKLVTLDRWAIDHRVPLVDLLKLDLQGHELEALHGARNLLRSSIKLVYTEVEFVRLYEKNCLFFEIEEFLRPLGFELFSLYNLTSAGDGQLLSGDAIFIARERLC